MVLLPEQKTKSAKTAQSCGFSAFKVLYFFRVQDAFLLEKNSSLFFKIFSTRGSTGFFDSLNRHAVRVPVVLYSGFTVASSR